MIWFTSDTHFNHANIAGPKISKWKRGYRNFDSVAQMNNTIIDNINRLVKPDDILYHLGDFAFGDKKKIPELRERLICNTIRLCYGNHDSPIIRNPEYQKLFDRCSYYYEIPYRSSFIILMHYCMKVWRASHHGAIHLYGHSHASLPDNPEQKCFDVGLDTTYPQYGVIKNFEPYSIDEIEKIAEQKIWKQLDHHIEGVD